MATPLFVDRVTLHLRAGHGGNGCVSVHREKFRPLGGPDGGNGGKGGDVVLVVDNGVHTLLDFHYHPHAEAPNGKDGQGSNRHGAFGKDLVLRVPNGTLIKTVDGDVLADLVGVGTRYVVASGGRGGLGNASLASHRRKAPGFALLGENGEETDVVLEVKSVADVGLVGFPSAGKSSLIAVVSAARPKIADYPFTTLRPNLGVVTAGQTVFTIADVPGLIPGAAQGKGLGLDFLRHIERCAVLVHVVDLATQEPGRDPLTDIDAIEAELEAYGGLETKPRLVALNKVDMPDSHDMVDVVVQELEDRFQTEMIPRAVFPVSAITHEGLKPFLFALAALVEAERARYPEEEPTRLVIRPIPKDDSGFVVDKDPETPGAFVVRGEKPERWVRQTNFSNEEAVGYLADRLARLGVEDALREAGAEEGASVTVGEVTFDWVPSIIAGGGHTRGPRGTDSRMTD